MSAWLALAYAALALGLGWMLAGGGDWRLRAPYVVLAPAVALALWLGRPNPAGWPTARAVPAHAALQWALVDEPDPAASDPGHIYLWLDVGGLAPRAYALPYSRTLHEQVQRALRRVAHGRSVALGRAQARVVKGRQQSEAGKRSVIRFYPHPAVQLPPKTH
jgi:hypothetical protein